MMDHIPDRSPERELARLFREEREGWDRENLEVITTVDGKEQDFFNEQDKLHMADVQGLFIGGLRLRTWAAAVLLICP